MSKDYAVVRVPRALLRDAAEDALTVHQDRCLPSDDCDCLFRATWLRVAAGLETGRDHEEDTDGPS